MQRVGESRLWQWLSRPARGHFREALHIDRVENSVMSGMPDVEGCLLGRQFWIELKCEPRPRADGAKIKPRFRPAQPQWILRRARAGGAVFVLLQVGAGNAARRYLIHGAQVVLLQNGMTEAKLSQLSVVPSNSGPEEIIRGAAFGDTAYD